LYEHLSIVNNFSLGNLLLKRLLLAIPQAKQTHHNFVMFYVSLHVDIPAEVEEMEWELAAWEANRDHQISDKSQQDPYWIPKSSEYFNPLHSCYLFINVLSRSYPRSGSAYNGQRGEREGRSGNGRPPQCECKCIPSAGHGNPEHPVSLPHLFDDQLLNDDIS
jgi:hypothetical protein